MPLDKNAVKMKIKKKLKFLWEFCRLTKRSLTKPTMIFKIMKLIKKRLKYEISKRKIKKWLGVRNEKLE